MYAQIVRMLLPIDTLTDVTLPAYTLIPFQLVSSYFMRSLLPVLTRMIFEKLQSRLRPWATFLYEALAALSSNYRPSALIRAYVVF